MVPETSEDSWVSFPPPGEKVIPQEFFYGTDLNLQISASLCPPSPHPCVDSPPRVPFPGQTALATGISSHGLFL